MKEHIRHGIPKIGRLVAYAGCGCLSLFILASGYESVYSRTLPLVHTLAKVDLGVLSADYNLSTAAVLKPNMYGQFGKPTKLTVANAQSSLRFSIVSPISDHGNWLARTATMHLLIPTKPLNGNISTEILYCRAGFRTIGATPLPAVGGNVFVDTDQNWRYVYKITLARTYVASYPYAPTDNGAKGKIIIFCNDTARQLNNVLEGDLISVQAVTQ